MRSGDDGGRRKRRAHRVSGQENARFARRAERIADEGVLGWFDFIAEFRPELAELVFRERTLEDALLHADAEAVAYLRHAAKALLVGDVVGNETEHG